MNKALRQVPARFDLETRFDVPVTSVPFRGATEQELERLKGRLLRPWLEDPGNAGRHRPLQHAANEAAVLAWLTPCPLLVFPALFEERIQAALQQADRQEKILERSQHFLTEVA